MAYPVSRPRGQRRSQHFFGAAEACPAALLASGPEGGMDSGLLHSMRVPGLQHASGSAFRSSLVDNPFSSTDG